MADITSHQTSNTSLLAQIISFDEYQRYFQELFDQRSGNSDLHTWSTSPCKCGHGDYSHALGIIKECYHCHFPSEDEMLEYFKYVNQIHSLRTPSGRLCEKCEKGTVYRFSKSGGHGALHVYAPCHYCLTNPEPQAKKECRKFNPYDHEPEGHWWCSDCEKYISDRSDCRCSLTM